MRQKIELISSLIDSSRFGFKPHITIQHMVKTRQSNDLRLNKQTLEKYMPFKRAFITQFDLFVCGGSSNIKRKSKIRMIKRNPPLT